MKSKKQQLIAVTTFFLCTFFFHSCLEEDTNWAANGSKLGEETYVYEVCDLYHGKEVTLGKNSMGGAHYISGIVISDPSGTNLPAGHMFLQGTDSKKQRGLAFSMDANDAVYRSLKMGDAIKIDVEGTTLTRKNGILMVQGLAGEQIKIIEQGTKVEPKSISVSSLAVDFSKYENMLVCVNAAISPLPPQDETLAGIHTLGDGSGQTIELKVDDSADFSSSRVMPSAQYTGICVYGPNGEKQLKMQFDSDMSFGCGPLYTKVGGKEEANFPEDFEAPDASVKNTYASKDIELKTGLWKMDQCLFGNTPGRDRFNPTGAQAIRFQQNLTKSAYLEMMFDVELGASKVTFSYGAYYTDAASTFQLEYSQDGGTTWIPTGSRVSDANKTAKIVTFMLDLKGNVRFRINKLGLGTTSQATGVENGRLSIDDFAIYQNEW